jgi:hypothetical protein
MRGQQVDHVLPQRDAADSQLRQASDGVADQMIRCPSPLAHAQMPMPAV